jgi:hypothetical protein
MGPHYNPDIFISPFPYLFLVILHVLQRDNVLQMLVLKHPILKHPQRWLMVCENVVLRRIFGPKRDEVTKDCFQNVCTTSSIPGRLRATP